MAAEFDKNILRKILKYKYNKNMAHVEQSETYREPLINNPCDLSIFPDGTSKVITNGLTLTVYKKKKLFGPIIFSEATADATRWYINGVIGRDGDLPAIQHANGDNEWYVIGVLGREGGLPAIERANGTKVWYLNGKVGRTHGLPAVEMISGRKEWYIDGKKDREGDLPAVEDTSGRLEWYKCGRLSRGNGLPAVEYADGQLSWYIDGNPVTPPPGYYEYKANNFISYYKDGMLHRDDPYPAVIYKDGAARWYCKGKRYMPDSVVSIETDTFIATYYKGQLHCSTGPAIIFKESNSYKYFMHGELIPPELVSNIIS